MSGLNAFVDYVFDRVDKTTKPMQSRLNELEKNINASGFSYSFATYTVNDLPSVTSFMVAFATDGRKSGESVGNGTGVPVYYDTSSSSWLTFFDNTVVVA
jgi:hypothetical protein